jgi:hypothetical protein
MRCTKIILPSWPEGVRTQSSAFSDSMPPFYRGDWGLFVRDGGSGGAGWLCSPQFGQLIHKSRSIIRFGLSGSAMISTRRGMASDPHLSQVML